MDLKPIVAKLLDRVSSLSAGPAHEIRTRGDSIAVQAFGRTTAGAGAATIYIEQSLDGTRWNFAEVLDAVHR